jgi:hypothetical protein
MSRGARPHTLRLQHSMSSRKHGSTRARRLLQPCPGDARLLTATKRADPKAAVVLAAKRRAWARYWALHELAPIWDSANASGTHEMRREDAQSPIIVLIPRQCRCSFWRDAHHADDRYRVRPGDHRHLETGARGAERPPGQGRNPRRRSLLSDNSRRSAPALASLTPLTGTGCRSTPQAVTTVAQLLFD